MAPKKIYVPSGEYAELLCTLNSEEGLTSNCTARNVAFYQWDEPVDFGSMLILNGTTKKLHKKHNTTESVYTYTCVIEAVECLSANWTSNQRRKNYYLESFGNPKIYISQATVIVGTVPRNATQFSCQLHEFSILKCQWWLNNTPSTTDYGLSFCTTHESEARCAEISCVTECLYRPDMQINFSDGKNNCDYESELVGQSVSKKHLWECNITSLPTSQQSFQNLELKLIGNNTFGNTTQIFSIGHIRPLAANLTQVTRTSTSIYVKWFIVEMRFFVPTMQFKTEYRWDESSKWLNQSYSLRELETESNEYVLLNVTDLIPNKNVAVRIFAKAELGNEDKFWSEPVQKIFRTSACRPYRPPKVDVGSFEIQRVSDRRHVFVYWQPLSEDEYNGDNFHYEVEAFKHNDPNRRHLLKPNLLGNSYARFDLDSDAYTILISSANAEGRSDSASEVRVPDEKNQVSVFAYLGSMQEDIRSTGNQMYRWIFSDNTRNTAINNFTVFQCANETTVQSRKSFVCEGQLSWGNAEDVKHTPLINLNKNFSWFAVSANTNPWSSGMQRYSCNEESAEEISIQIDFIGPTFINMSWYLHCAIYENTEKYFLKLFYCTLELNSTDNGSCTSGKPASVALNLHTRNYQLNHLSFYTTYRINMRLLKISNTLSAPESYSEEVTTKEGPPDITGVKINVSEVTNSTANLTWDKPKKVNGILRYYQINYGSEQINHTSNETRFLLRNLNPYTGYNVTLKTCTVECSVEITSEPFMTKIGPPGDITLEKEVRQKTATFRWQKPQIPGGPQPTYEFIQIVKDNKHNHLLSLSNPVGPSETTLEPDCSNDTIIYEFQVRAVNKYKHPQRNFTKYYYGPWSNSEAIDCSLAELASTSTLPLLVGIFICLLILLFLGSFQAYISYENYLKPKIKAMKDINIHIPRLYKLPLNVCKSNDDEDDGSDHQVPNFSQIDQFPSDVTTCPADDEDDGSDHQVPNFSQIEQFPSDVTTCPA